MKHSFQILLLLLCIGLLLFASCGEQNSETSSSYGNCTISIICSSVFKHQENLSPEKKDIVPQSGFFANELKVGIAENDTVFTILQKVCREQKIHLEYEFSPSTGANFIEGIGNLYNGDCGSVSGWIFAVNKVIPSVGCDRAAIKEGDHIELLFICDYMNDIPADFTWGE